MDLSLTNEENKYSIQRFRELIFYLEQRHNLIYLYPV